MPLSGPILPCSAVQPSGTGDRGLHLSSSRLNALKQQCLLPGHHLVFVHIHTHDYSGGVDTKWSSPNPLSSVWSSSKWQRQCPPALTGPEREGNRPSLWGPHLPHCEQEPSNWPGSLTAGTAISRPLRTVSPGEASAAGSGRGALFLDLSAGYLGAFTLQNTYPAVDLGFRCF